MPRPRGPRPGQLNAGEVNDLRWVHGEAAPAIIAAVEAELVALREHHHDLDDRAVMVPVCACLLAQHASRTLTDGRDRAQRIREARRQVRRVVDTLLQTAPMSDRLWLRRLEPFRALDHAIAVLDEWVPPSAPSDTPPRPKHRPPSGVAQAVAQLRAVGLDGEEARDLLRAAGAIVTPRRR